VYKRQAYAIANRVDFISVGSNDLTQYLLAVDRNNAHVGELYDMFHPAVLQALLNIVDSAHKAGKPVSICGEMASDPPAVVLLLAMGFDALSINSPFLLRIKWIVRNFSLLEAKKLLNDVLSMETGWQIRAYIERKLEDMGLGGLIRAGRK
jgi:phosphotransferase system enzyme I (PtsP)